MCSALRMRCGRAPADLRRAVPRASPTATHPPVPCASVSHTRPFARLRLRGPAQHVRSAQPSCFSAKKEGLCGSPPARAAVLRLRLPWSLVAVSALNPPAPPKGSCPSASPPCADPEEAGWRPPADGTGRGGVLKACEGTTFSPSRPTRSGIPRRSTGTWHALPPPPPDADHGPGPPLERGAPPHPPPTTWRHAEGRRGRPAAGPPAARQCGRRWTGTRWARWRTASRRPRTRA